VGNDGNDGQNEQDVDQESGTVINDEAARPQNEQHKPND
jgi:hypothetical protein